MSGLLEELRAIVGREHVLCEGDLSAWEVDWRHRACGKAFAVVQPANTAQVARLVKACHAAGNSIVAQGGNTGLTAGSTPDASGRQVVLSMTRMNLIRAINVANLTVTVEAGCVLQVLQDAAEQAGLLFPLSLAAQGSCTIGGNLATNAGGSQVMRYGNARDLCLGIEVVTSGGEVWDGTSGLRKDNTGYSLRDLLIGSEGTLGIITAATLKLYPLPTARLIAWAALPSLAHAVALLTLSQKWLSAGLTAFEVMGKFALDLVSLHMPHLKMPLGKVASPYCVLIEYSDSESELHARERFESLLEAALEAESITDAVVAESIRQARELWSIREHIPMAQAVEGPNIKLDISVEISRIPEFVEHTDAKLHQAFPGIRLVNFGHLGDGNLHYNIQAPAVDDAAAFVREAEGPISTLVYDEVARFNGSFSAEHGVGELKIHALEKHSSPVALNMMRAVKQALDPSGIFNPGRVLRRADA